MFKKKVAILTLVSVISSFSANTTAVLAHELTKNEEKISTQENSADNNEESKTAQNLETSQEEEKSQEQEKSQTEWEVFSEPEDICRCRISIIRKRLQCLIPNIKKWLLMLCRNRSQDMNMR